MSRRVRRDQDVEYGCDCTLENCCGKKGCDETDIVASEQRVAAGLGWDCPLPPGWAEVAVNTGTGLGGGFDRQWPDGEYSRISQAPASLHLCSDCSLREYDFTEEARARRCNNCRARVVDPDGSNDLLDWGGGWFRCAACSTLYQAYDALGLPMPLGIEREE